jgi:hypothetical protein
LSSAGPTSWTCTTSKAPNAMNKSKTLDMEWTTTTQLQTSRQKYEAGFVYWGWIFRLTAPGRTCVKTPYLQQANGELPLF